MDVAVWLRSVGLERYEPAFRENNISADLLSSLTAEDLKDLGVTLVGDRRRLLDAIATLKANRGSPVEDSAPAPIGGSRPGLASPASAERRQLTVMFCDLVGSTALAARLDPEDLREVIGAYHRCVAEAVARFEGFVAKYMGDGVLVYFGYPRAHEDDAERAVRAGLALVEAVEQLQAPERLQIRIGIGTGLVVVGDLVGSGEAQERGVVGETPNLAARLQALAEPNTIIVGSSTHRLIGDLFEYRDLGMLEVKGYDERVQAFRVLRPSAVESRFEALRAGALTPLIGRGEEVELLLRCWQQVNSGEGQVVLLSGEPGIGKSRIAATLQERIEGEPHVRLRYFCSPYYQDSALHPIIAQLERAARFEREDSAETKLGKLEALLAPMTSSSEEVALLAELLSVPASERYPPHHLSPQRKKEKTFEALIRQLDLLSHQQPVLMVYEDVHWIDPTSQELLDLAVARAQRLPLLLLITFRPEFEPMAWTGQPHATIVELSRLGRRETTALVEGIAGNRALPPEIVDKIAERTDGVPLFVEELTKATLESGAPAAAARSAAPRPALSVPATLEASLMARLDRLGPEAKEIAQVGAAFGRDFSYGPLEAVAPKSDKLDESLDRLVDAGLIFGRGTRPDTGYTFKHALVQDAAYASLLRSSRKRLHARIAGVLEEKFPETGESKPEVLAHHHGEAGQYIQAVEYYLRAGRRALERSANVEAAAHLRKGLDALNQLPLDGVRLQRELDLQMALGPALMPIKGWGAPEVERTYARARELCHQLGAVPQLFSALRGLWEYYELRAQVGPATEIAQEILSIAEHAADRTLLLVAHDVMGDNSLWIGDFSAAHSHTAQGIALYDPALDSNLAYSHGGYDPAMACRAFGAHALWYLGYPTRAAEQSQDAVKFARDLEHPQSLVHALSHGALLHQFRRNAALVLECAQAACELGRQLESAFWMAHPAVSLGWALANLGQRDEGILKIKQGMAGYRATGAELERTLWLAILTDVLLSQGALDEAIAALMEAFSESENTGASFHLAELHRLQGEVLLRTFNGSREQAESYFHRALQIARDQKAKSVELRAATSLARLWGGQGKRTEARALLRPVYGWFTEGFDTPDLTDAQALLNQLNG
jgi:class 3 adenylate cyclase/predicted ATPase